MNNNQKSNHKKSFEVTKTVHITEPDFNRPLLKIPPESHKRMLTRLGRIYGEAIAKASMPELERILEVYYAHKPQEMIDK